MAFRLFKPVVPVTISTLITLSACGGSSTGIIAPAAIDNNNQSNVEPIDIGAALPDTNPETDTDLPALDTISGKVADGYLRGATVCVDINENESCDDDEPQTISVAGGAYTLNISGEHSGKPILAEVPADAIDEDTGEAFGRDVIFSTPADRPGFISPLTTLVQQELKDNPALSIEDAESALEEALGLDNADETGLFKDYVALAETGDEDSRQKYQYLHQTARVVAGMMGDIRESVRDSVTASGVDLEGDKDARKAMRQLVQAEVRALIPEIAQAVANKIHEIESVDESDETSDSTTLTVAFNPDELIESLRPTDVTDNVTERIEALKEERAVESVTMDQLLARGIYTLDIDCQHTDEYYEEDDIPSNEIKEEFNAEDDLTPEQERDVNVMLNDDGEFEFEELPEYCSARYSTIKVESADRTISIADYYYDASSAAWVEEIEEHTNEAHLLMLIDGDWTDAAGGTPESVLEYTEDGGAILNTDGGTIFVSANARQLDNTAVAQHLRNLGAEQEFYKLVDQAAIFPTDSWVYRLFIKRDTQQHLLFNWPSEDDDGNCTQYSENCNLVDIKDDSGFIPLTTIAELQEASLNEATINEIFFDHFDRVSVDLTLTAEPMEDGSPPVEGKAKWITAYESVHTEYPQLPDTEGYEEKYQLVTDNKCFDFNEATLLDDETAIDFQTGAADKPYPETDDSCPTGPEVLEIENNPDLERQIQFDETDGTVYTNAREAKDRALGYSKWHLIEVDGQIMIEIQLPVIVRHRFEQDDVATFLLAEQGGYVRRGMKLSDVNIDNETAYSMPAFETLKPLSELYVTE